MMITCIAVDDEPLALELIQEYCQQIGHIHLEEKFTDPIKALRYLEEHVVDVVFLDIQMPQLNGIGFARITKGNTMCVFTTAYEQYAVESYEIVALDYLLKPFSFDRFYQTYQKVVQRLQTATNPPLPCGFPPHLFISVDGRSKKIATADILYIQGYSDYVLIVTQRATYTIRENLKTIAARFHAQGFIRVHKSYIVSLANIDEIFGNIIRIRDVEVPIGKAYRNDVLAAIRATTLG